MRKNTAEVIIRLNRLGGDWDCARAEDGSGWQAVKYDDTGAEVKRTMPERSASAAIRRLLEILSANLG